MEKNSFRIKSKFIIKKVFDFIKDNNLKLKLVLYSKAFQEILKITLYDYKEQYFNKIGINFNEYYTLKNQKNFNANKFNKNLLNENLKSFINKNNISLDSLNSYIVDYYKKNFGNFNSKIFIDIYSPFFDVLSKGKCFELFIIPIEMDIIQKHQLLENYKNKFENLKNFSVKINFINEKDILLLKDIINFEEIKELDMINIGNDKNVNYDKLFSSIFSVKDFGIKLTDLNLKIHDYWSKITDSGIFEKINNFQNLKTLELNGFKFPNNIQLNLNNLSSLILKNCSNIILSDSQSLKSLFISNCIIIKNKYLVKFVNLEKCEIFYQYGEKYNTIIDFTNFKNLKNLSCRPSDFIYLPYSTLLEKANISLISSQSDDGIEIENKKIEKIIKLKNLKEITFDLYNNNFEELLYRSDKNSSLKKMNVEIKEIYNNGQFLKFIEKFENLTELNINYNFFEEEPGEMELKIKECKNCKIDKLSINGHIPNNSEIYCGPYSNLVKLNLNENLNLINMKETFPLFQDNCQIIFDKLKDFYYINIDIMPEEIPFEVLNNLYHNLDKAPNLKNIRINCLCKINKEFYTQFVKKLLEMKLDSIDLKIYERDKENYNGFNEYTLEELKQIYPLTLNDKKYTIVKYFEGE